jgi:hypothetical protein
LDRTLSPSLPSVLPLPIQNASTPHCNAGSLGSVFGARKRGIQPDGAVAIHSLLSSSPQIRNIRWHHQLDFDAGREDNGQTEPTQA